MALATGKRLRVSETECSRLNYSPPSAASPSSLPPPLHRLLSPLPWLCGQWKDVCWGTAPMWNTGHSEGTEECFHQFYAAGCAAGTVCCRLWWSHTLNSGTEFLDASLEEHRDSKCDPATAPVCPRQVLLIHAPANHNSYRLVKMTPKSCDIWICTSNYYFAVLKNNWVITSPKAFFDSWMAVFGIWPRSGFLIPCIRLMWFFNITFDVNIVFVSVQYLKKKKLEVDLNDFLVDVIKHATMW